MVQTKLDDQPLCFENEGVFYFRTLAGGTFEKLQPTCFAITFVDHHLWSHAFLWVQLVFPEETWENQNVEARQAFVHLAKRQGNNFIILKSPIMIHMFAAMQCEQFDAIPKDLK